DALEPDREADVGHRAVGVAQQRGGALQASREQVRVRRLAERAPEAAAEVGAGEAGRAGQVVHLERLEVARVGEVLGAQEVRGGGYEGHGPQYCAWGPATSSSSLASSGPLAAARPGGSPASSATAPPASVTSSAPAAESQCFRPRSK